MKLDRILKILMVIMICILSIFSVFGMWLNMLNAGADHNVIGWAWSGHFGWISFNSTNMKEPINYGVHIEDNGDIVGYAWAVNLAINPGILPPPDPRTEGYIAFSSPGDAHYDSTTGSVYGYARIRIDGWDSLGNISLRGNLLVGEDKPPGPYPYCLDCSEREICLDDPPPAEGEECSNKEIQRDCKICHTKQDESLVCKYGCGNICFSCNSCSEIVDKTSSCDACGSCYKYGVGIISESGQWTGWGWNGIDTNFDLNSDAGWGWIRFSDVFYGAVPWVEVRYGSAYAGDDITAQELPPFGHFNVMYFLHANGDIQNFTCEGVGCQKTDFGDLKFPKLANKYTNALGKIDMGGILEEKYGIVEPLINADNLDNSPLNQKIFRYFGDLIIDNPLNFVNGVGSVSGAGLVVVEGDLTINADITYDSAGILNFKNMASVGWIIKGDLIINPSVEEISGAFIVLGDDNDPCPDLSVSSDSCGRVDTGTVKDADPGASDAVNLEVNGLLMAKQFRFARQYANIFEGSEVIINDGRLSTNTPPGMADLTKALPVFRPSAP